MRLTVRVHPGSAHDRVAMTDGVLHVWVTATAVDGRANRATLRAIAGWSALPVSAVRLVAGARARSKIVDVDGLETHVEPGPG